MDFIDLTPHQMFCQICCENKEKLENCLFCPDVCCLECIQKGLLINESEPHCMFCKKLISMEHIMTINPRSWIKKMYLPHVTKIRVQQEMNLLINDQSEAKTILKLRALRAEYSKLPLIKRIKKIYKDPQQLQSKLEETRKEQLRIRKEIKSLEISPPKQNKQKSFHGFCPTDNCKGMLDENFTCQLCDVLVCHDCGELLTKDHKCLEENKKSFQSVQKDSKPCPQCGVPIFQSSGCDQMWCVLCYTPFSWSSGKRIKGVIHNPHYYEWLSSDNHAGGGHTQELNCDELPTAPQFRNFLYFHYPNDSSIHFWYKIHQAITHLREIVIPLLNHDNIPNDNSLRVKYLIGDIDEKGWCHLLQYRQERRMKCNALYFITDLSIQLFTDLIGKFIKEPKNPPYIQEIMNVWNFIENNLNRACQIYGGGLPREWKQVVERMRLL